MYGSTQRLFSKILRRPAPGFRNFSSGVLTHTGNFGYSWSRTIFDIYARLLDFYAVYLTATSANYRAYGLQLRCLSE
ncbi:hypothetical protein [uncultured Rikenella sp.]|uniref:hypothetical protein n=1 Tax=uncultured Rikenella sp. TaxID=368003 RepID=UPI00272A42CC|nr:hypothetical protein [uncultured Rikenella sp.]